MYTDPNEEPGHLLADMIDDDTYYMLIEAHSFMVGRSWKDRCEEVALSNPDLFDENVGLEELKPVKSFGVIMRAVFSRPCEKCRKEGR